MTGDGLHGRTALVTGASQGIGHRIALRLAKAGAAVALAARSRAALAQVERDITAAGGRAIVAPTDVGDAAQVARLVDTAERALGPLDVVVASTGIAGPTRELWRIEPVEWEETFRVNVAGVFLVCRAALPGMIERGSGSVVVVGSATGKRPLPGRTPYAASKTALIGLVRSLASEVGPFGVRVNLVSPGPIEGDRLDAVIARQAAARDADPATIREEMAQAAPLRRLSPPDDIAEVVAFLAGDRARSITGEDLNVSAGWVMH